MPAARRHRPGASRRGALSCLAGLSLPALASAQFTSEPITDAVAGEPYQYAVTADGIGNVEITAPAGLPPWLTLTRTGSGGAILAGTPLEAGQAWEVLLQAEDNFCRSFTLLCQRQAFTIVVATAPANRPPVVIPPGIGDRSATIGEPITIDVAGAFSDPDGDPLSFLANGLPVWLELSGSLITGVPPTAAGSPHQIRVVADDGRGGSVEDQFTLTVPRLAAADLAIRQIAAAPAPGLRGEPVEWRIEVANLGPDAGGAATLTLDFYGSALAFANHACQEPAAAGSRRLVCTIAALAAGAASTVVIEATAAQRGDVWLDAAITTPTLPADPDAANNRAQRAVNIGESVSAVPAQRLAPGPIIDLVAGDFDGGGGTDLVAAAADGRILLFPRSASPAGLAPALTGPADLRLGLASGRTLLEQTAATALAAADFDGDGLPDLAVAAAAGTSSAVYRNLGDGRLERFSTLGAADSADRAIAAGDLNGDGIADVVVAAAGSIQLISSPGLTAAPASSTVVGSAAARRIVIADLVGSPLPDLVVVNLGGAIDIYENLGAAAFQSVTSLADGASSAAVADFNADGLADLAIGRADPASGAAPSNEVYLGSGAGSLLAAEALGASPTALILARDFNADAVPDVLSVNHTGAHQLFFGNGNGNFSLQSMLIASGGPVAAVSAAFGRREGNDLALADADGISIFFDDGLGRLGVGDTEPPVIELIGPAQVEVVVDTGYADAGATASDNIDREITPSTDNAVDTATVGVYQVTYRAMDLAGNAAVPVSRQVTVSPRAAEGGGGGAADLALISLLLLVLAVRPSAKGKP